MTMKSQRTALLVFALALAALIVAIPKAAALPGTGLMSAMPMPANPKSVRTDDPAIVVEQGFEQLLGRELSRGEERQLNKAIREFEKFQASQERPQKANFVTDFFSTREFLPVFCFHGKGSIKIPALSGVNLGGAGISAERTPCLLTNSLLPWQWRKSEFKSYIMKGFSGTVAGPMYGGLSAGVAFGIYTGPKNLSKQFIGTYAFARIMYEIELSVGSANTSILAAYNEHNQAMLMAGAAGEIGWDSMYNVVTKIIPRLPKAPKPGVPIVITPWRIEIGVNYDVKEFPWFSRIMNGMNPISAFSDMEQYIASNN